MQRAGWMPLAASTHYITWHWAGVKGASRSFILGLPRETSPGCIVGYQPSALCFLIVLTGFSTHSAGLLAMKGTFMDGGLGPGKSLDFGKYSML